MFNSGENIRQQAVTDLKRTQTGILKHGSANEEDADEGFIGSDGSNPLRAGRTRLSQGKNIGRYQVSYDIQMMSSDNLISSDITVSYDMGC